MLNYQIISNGRCDVDFSLVWGCISLLQSVHHVLWPTNQFLQFHRVPWAPALSRSLTSIPLVPEGTNNGKLLMPGMTRTFRLALSFVIPLRLGQEPPPQPQEDSYDGRSLAEVCLAQVSY